MVVNKKNWSPWHHSPPPPAAGAKKFRVKVERIKLEGFEHGTGGGEKVMGVELRWKGERKHGLAAVGFHRRRQELRWCKERTVRKGEVIVWEEDDELENVCLFSETSAIGGEIDGHKFVPWIGEYMKGKMSKIGKVSLDLAEFVSKIESPVIEKKLPVDLMVSGLTTQATISVLLSFVEIRDSGEFDSESTQLEGTRVVRAKKKQLSLEDVSLSDSDDSVMFDSDATSELLSTTPPSSSVVVNPDITDKKTGIFDWKRRRLNFRPSKTKVEDSRPVTLFSNDSVASGDKYKTLVNNSFQNTWETREFVSRDGESKLITQTFFASFDQRSDKAAGPSACTALVTVMAHWLMSNDSTTMPTVQEFDTLIIDGSSEWRTLCENTTHVAEFPDKHFDLETVLRARIRPLTVSRVKSFVGFFSPEKFDSLTGVMSFDDIWDREISRNLGVYIVSWNDHFFVLKVDEDGYYVIDTLGERLVEGCEQAYILRFDNGSSLTESGTDQVVCKGKECCKGFIKKFLAAIPLKELETEERKQAVPYYSLHHRLQIEFNFCSMV
ncbi:putative NT-type C2 domain-containing protein [Helianthus annuus]|nr:putative NT-type C2 domain-containing protein [Helianthus annuus]KAJ0687626.1 putative NT-type C2 domain-containing protein [Helianthus annuus]